MSFLRALFAPREPTPHERRAHARLRTRLRPGKLVDGDGAFVADAAIIDRSASGARLRFFDEAGTGEVHALFDESEAVLRPVRAVWQDGHEVGVAFSGEPQPLDEAKRQRLSGPYYAVAD